MIIDCQHSSAVTSTGTVAAAPSYVPADRPLQPNQVKDFQVVRASTGQRTMHAGGTTDSSNLRRCH